MIKILFVLILISAPAFAEENEEPKDMISIEMPESAKGGKEVCLCFDETQIDLEGIDIYAPDGKTIRLEKQETVVSTKEEE